MLLQNFTQMIQIYETAEKSFSYIATLFQRLYEHLKYVLITWNLWFDRLGKSWNMTSNTVCIAFKIAKAREIQNLINARNGLLCFWSTSQLWKYAGSISAVCKLVVKYDGIDVAMCHRYVLCFRHRSLVVSSSLRCRFFPHHFTRFMRFRIHWINSCVEALHIFHFSKKANTNIEQ